jgi:hypothetical protein
MAINELVEICASLDNKTGMWGHQDAYPIYPIVVSDFSLEQPTIESFLKRLGAHK